MFSQALGQELRLLWGDFEDCLLDAGEFVATQTPMKAQGLQESIVVSEEWDSDEKKKEGGEEREGERVETREIVSTLTPVKFWRLQDSIVVYMYSPLQYI